MFPEWMHSALCRMLPFYWKCKAYLENAKTLLAPKIADLLRKSDEELWKPESEEDCNVLAWLADLAKGNDRDPEKLAHVEVLLALASVHTTLLRMVNVVYDLTANPHFIGELREEISSTKDEGWNRSSYSRLQKLDSVLRESQRMSPPTTLGLKRLFRADYTFENGTHVSKGAYVCMPIYAIENDAENTVHPESFDGLRNYRLRQRKAESEEHQFISAEPTCLNFGYGKSACPGRYFAALVLKMLFVKLLSEYDFQFLPGAGRPKNVLVHEFLFPWPWDRMLIRRREAGVCPF